MQAVVNKKQKIKLKVITENLPQLSKCSADLFDKSGGVIELLRLINEVIM
jgi:hypothetical protein